MYTYTAGQPYTYGKRRSPKFIELSGASGFGQVVDAPYVPLYRQFTAAGMPPDQALAKAKEIVDAEKTATGTEPTTSQQIATATTSVLENLSSNLARIFTSGQVPAGPAPKPQPRGGVPYTPTPRGQRAQVPALPGVFNQRVGPFTLGQWAIGGGVGLLTVALMRNVVRLAVIGGAVAGGAWVLSRTQAMPGQRVGQQRRSA